MDTIKTYSYIKAILENGSFSDAADSLFISQPSLSQYISRIEKEINAEILVRKSAPIKLTEEGKIFYSSLKQINLINDKTYETIQDIKNLEQGTVTIGALGYHSIGIISKVLETFHLDYPGIKVNIMDGSILELEKFARDGNVDFSLLIKPNYNENLNYFDLGEEDIFLAINKDHRLVKDKNITFPQGKLYPYIDLNELSGENFITLSIEKRLRRSYEEAINIMDKMPVSITETNDVINSLILASAGIGVAFCPDALSEIFKNSLNLVYLKPIQVIKKRKIIAGFNSSFPLSKSAEKFLNCLIEFYKTKDSY